MFAGEAWGLRAMRHTNSLRVPRVLYSGPLVIGDGSFIVLEHFSFSSCSDQAALGRQLARMHAVRFSGVPSLSFPPG